jgi:hypothetical protein
VPSLFRRKAEPEPEKPAVEEPRARTKGYTPSKSDLGKQTPKRPPANPRRATKPPANRKEAAQRTREARAEQRAGMMAGDERYLLPRDKGPERALTRDIIDSRFTIGTWFFSFAILLFLGSTLARAIPPTVLLVLNAVWALLGLAVIVDSFLITRRIRREVLSRYPKTTQRMGGLYIYAIMRAVTYRRMRIPRPRLKIGDKIEL